MFAAKAKMYGVLCNQSSSIGLDKTIVIGQRKKLLISRLFIGHHKTRTAQPANVRRYGECL